MLSVSLTGLFGSDIPAFLSMDLFSKASQTATLAPDRKSFGR